jgi:hypothetical protein
VNARFDYQIGATRFDDTPVEDKVPFGKAQAIRG